MSVSKQKDEAKAAAAAAEKQELRDVLVQVKETLRDTVASVEALDARLRRVEADAAAKRGGFAARWLPRALGGAGPEPWPQHARA